MSAWLASFKLIFVAVMLWLSLEKTDSKHSQSVSKWIWWDDVMPYNVKSLFKSVNYSLWLLYCLKSVSAQILAQRFCTGRCRHTATTDMRDRWWTRKGHSRNLRWREEVLLVIADWTLEQKFWHHASFTSTPFPPSYFFTFQPPPPTISFP